MNSIPLIEARRINYNLTLKGHDENWPKITVITRPEKVMLHTSRSASSAWAHLWCFPCSSWPLSKVIAENLLLTFHDLNWPRRHEQGLLVAIFRFRVSSLAVTRCWRVLNGVRRREVPFNFIPSTYNGEVAKLIWPHRYQNSEIDIL